MQNVQYCRLQNDTTKVNAEFRIAKRLPDGSFAGRDDGWRDVFPGKSYEFDLIQLIGSGAIQSGDVCMIQWQYDEDGFESQRNLPGKGAFVAALLEKGQRPRVAESHVQILAGSTDEAIVTPIEIRHREK